MLRLRPIRPHFRVPAWCRRISSAYAARAAPGPAAAEGASGLFVRVLEALVSLVEYER
jgi:hypothetical protein